MSRASFYKWPAKFGGMDASLIAGMKDLAEQNLCFRKMHPEMRMQNALLNEALGKNRKGRLTGERRPRNRWHSRRQSVSKRTAARADNFPGWGNSFGDWLRSLLQGLKTVATGAIREKNTASCPAPLALHLCDRPGSIADCASFPVMPRDPTQASQRRTFLGQDYLRFPDCAAELSRCRAGPMPPQAPPERQRFC